MHTSRSPDATQRRYLKFVVESQTYQFNCLPFSLSSAPWVFTKTLKPVAALMREMSVRMIVYIDDILIMAETRERAQEQAEALVVFRVHCQQEEVSTDPSTNNGLPGLHSGHCVDATEVAWRENEKYPGRGTETRKRGMGLSKGPLQTSREDECNNAGHPTSPPFLSTPANEPCTSFREELTELRHRARPLTGVQRRTEVVGQPHEQVEWKDPYIEGNRSDNRVPDGMGSILPGTEDRRSLDRRRGADAQ